MATNRKKTQPAFGERATSLFAKHLEADVLYFTADGLAFVKQCDAHNHAAELDNQKITTIKRENHVTTSKN